MITRPGAPLRRETSKNDYDGSFGLALRNEDGDLVLLTAAHVVRGSLSDVWSVGHTRSSLSECGSSCKMAEAITPGVVTDAGFIEFDASDGVLPINVVDLPSSAPVGANPPQVVGASPRQPAKGMRVWKFGATTGFTVGTIERIDKSTMPSSKWPSFLRIKPEAAYPKFGDFGDSGAAIMDFSGHPIALLVGGNPQGVTAIPMTEVLRDLKCRIS